jgi:hypothetical protein
MLTMTRPEWLQKGKDLFGEDFRDWKFVCPICGTIQDAKDFFKAGVDRGKVSSVLGFSCIGRFTGAGPYKEKGPQQKGCDWTLGGLFQLHRLEVIDEKGTIHPVFEFAEVQVAQTMEAEHAVQSGERPAASSTKM